MSTIQKSIPKPLVTINQTIIVVAVLTTWITGIEWFLAIPLLSGISGLLFNVNPIMKISKIFLRQNPSSYIQEDWEQQQFNQMIAVVCLTIGLTSFLFNIDMLAYLFTAMVAIAAGVALMGFCIGCFIRFQWKQLNYKLSK